MKTLLLSTAIGLVLGGATLWADGPATRCYEDESDRSFSTNEIIQLGAEVSEKMPSVEWDEEGKSAKLKWEPRPANYSTEVEEIGRFRGMGIYRVRYVPRPGSPDTDMPTVMFGIETITPLSRGIRPFYISAGDPALTVESKFSSAEDRPFSLEIMVHVPGNGMMWSRFDFGFSSGGARLLESASGGRKMFATTQYYDKSGKVIKTVTDTEN